MSSAPITPEFRDKAPRIMSEIIDYLQDFDVTAEDAAAILGSFGVETGGFTMRQEVGKPNKDTTGYGWPQWTGMDPGERRLLFEQWCDANGFGDVVDEPDDSPDERYEAACMGYFIHEISETWEKRVLTDGGTISGTYYPPLKKCLDLKAKTISFMKLFERPGTPHEDWRVEMAEEALRLFEQEQAYPGAEPLPEETAMYKSIVISSGHGKYVRGANGIIDEVDEARLVTERLAEELCNRGVNVVTFHDDTSKDQSTNLKTIANAHNELVRELDISVHFNAYEQVSKPMGVEVLYVTQQQLAAQVSAAIASVGFINRGAKKRTNLYFLNETEMPAILLEVCFVDSEADCEIYTDEMEAICTAIADVLGGPVEGEGGIPIEPEPVVARVDIEVAGDVAVYINGEKVA